MAQPRAVVVVAELPQETRRRYVTWLSSASGDAEVANGSAAMTTSAGDAERVGQQSVAGELSPFLERDRWVTVWGCLATSAVV